MKNPPRRSQIQQLDIKADLKRCLLMLFTTLKTKPKLKSVTPTKMANLNIFRGSCIGSKPPIWKGPIVVNSIGWRTPDGPKNSPKRTPKSNGKVMAMSHTGLISSERGYPSENVNFSNPSKRRGTGLITVGTSSSVLGGSTSITHFP